MKNKYFSIHSFLFLCCFSPFISGISQSSKEIKIEAQIVKFANNDCKGSLEIFTIEGITPFKYSIDGGKTFHDNKIFENLCEGKYFIQVKDAAGSYGITLVNLTPNQNPDIFNEAENEAIRQSTIKDFLLERDRVMDNWLVRREIEYKLSRIGHRFSPIITNKTESSNSISYTFKVIKMNAFSKETMLTEYERQLVGFKGYLIEIIYDDEAGTTTAVFNKETPLEILNNFFLSNGFSEINN